MNANPSAPAPTEGSAAVRLGTALEYAQGKTGYRLVDILDEATSKYFAQENYFHDDALSDSALIGLIYESF